MDTELFVPAFQNPTGSPIRELFPYLSQPNMISFAGGYPSPTLFDAIGLADASRSAMAEASAALQYGPTEGNATLRNELTRLCVDRRIQLTPQELLVTTGSQQAFDLLVRVLVEPGDVVLIETPAYPAAIQALRLAGAKMLEISMDSAGLKIEHLREVLERLPAGQRPKLLYTVPSFSNPRGSLLPTARRKDLIALARSHGFLIVEDDPYGELTFTGEQSQAIYSLAKEDGASDNPVVYLSSLSKTVAPALRVGWMVASAEIVRRCTIAKQTVDLCTSPITQLIAARYLQSGRYPRTVASAREEYKLRVQAMTDALQAELGDQLRFDVPQGGMFLWMQSAVPVDPARLFEAAVEEGVLFVPGTAFFPNTSSEVSMRLSFAAPTVTDIRKGVSRLARAFHSSTTL